MIDPQLTGKVVLITGANNPRGIGAAIASAFAYQGARVLLSYLRIDPEAYGVSLAEAMQATETGMPLYHALRTKSADEVVASIRSAGGWVAAHEADLTDAQQIRALFEWCEQVAGSVDVLVNNAAAYCEEDTIFTATFETFQQTFAMNVGATEGMIAEYVRHYQRHNKKQGRIISLSTDAAQLFPGQINYGSSKAAIEALTRAVAYEVGPLGITVNAIAPGPTQTGYIPAERAATLVDEIPLRRLGSPEDIADAALFLASAQASWITGQVIRVSGGHVM